MNRKLKDREISTQIEFVVHSEGIPTKVRSNNYNENVKGKIYSTPIFLDDKGFSKLELIVSFPRKDKYVYSSVIGMAGLSFLLTIIVVILSSSSLYLILKQKKISEMKSDFINNMSHEFKTPIATINLALDAISSSKPRSFTNKVPQYVQMIREENQRMLSQVENVLMISRLEKSTSPIVLSEIDLHLTIENAVRHIDLIVRHQRGEIKTFLNASNTMFKGNLNHFTNVIVNILDNAIKYSEKKPVIKIGTANSENGIELRITDEGIGMDIATQKHVFEKFYRLQSGNIHHIKGHGLGLSYVKKIVDIHGGNIIVKSKVGHGTTFLIKLPCF